MSTTVIYKNAFFYEVAMRMLYGRYYSARYSAIADLIPEGSTVLDLCCGPAVLFDRYLRRKRIEYTGLDMSESFIKRLRARGGKGEVWDLLKETALPQADCVVMQASLMHFLPSPLPVIGRMLHAARQRVIIAEPIRNLAESTNPVVAMISRRLTDPGNGKSSARFNQQTLDKLFLPFADLIEEAFLIPGGREKIYVLNSTPSTR